MLEKNKVEVVINGQVYTLIGQESQEYMQRVALYIDSKINDILSSDRSSKLNMSKVAILTSINVADDLFKSEEKLKQLIKVEEKLKELNYECENSRKIAGEKTVELDLYKDELGKMQEENIIYKERIEQLQLELMRAKSELDEYITTFENKKNKKRTK